VNEERKSKQPELLKISMAKLGEGDKRWIVEERADGANVHNWHWAERDCIQWARKRLADLLEDVKVLEGSGGLWIRTDKVESVTGEAYVNIRKGKIIPGYELTVSLSWKGEAKDGEGNLISQVEGRVQMPYIADENSDEDPELRVSVLDDTPVGSRFRDAFLARGKAVVLEKVRDFVKEMQLGGPAKEEIEQGKLNASKSSAKQPKSQEPAKVEGADGGQKSNIVKKKKEKEREGFKTISLIEKFHCQPRDIYDTLMDEKRWKGFTQSKAVISRDVGGQFSIFDGAVSGVNLKLEEDKLIVQKWRFQNWPDDHYSTVSSNNEL
jgi:activator of HSP90 ATPase